jgi:hypothetical protein
MYVTVPKAACTTILTTLQWLEADGDESRLPDDPHDKRNSPLLGPLDDMRLFKKAMKTRCFLKFSFVRNPYTRILSCYLDKIAGHPDLKRAYLPKLGLPPDGEFSFREFLELVGRQQPREMNVHWAPQSFLLSSDKVGYDFLGRVERLETDLARVLDMRDLPAPPVSRRARSHATGAHKRLSDFYGPEEIALVREIYAEDFTRFGYSRCPAPS